MLVSYSLSLWDLPLREVLKAESFQFLIIAFLYFNKFSLKDLARRYLSIYVDKSLAKKFGDTDTLTDELIQYSCKDYKKHADS